MKDLFTQAELDQIKAAVSDAEERTSGEIVPYFVERSDRYDVTLWRGASILAILAICIAGSATVSLLLARSWQAKLFNPGGFQQEYHGLNFGRGAAILLLVAGLAAMLTQSLLMTGVLAMLIAVFLLQGVAIAHNLVKLRSMGMGWLVGMYTLCFLLPQTSVLLSGVGVVDPWVDFRKRFGGRAENDN